MDKHIAILTICNRYWKRFAICENSWNYAMQRCGEWVNPYVGTIDGTTEEMWAHSRPGRPSGWHFKVVDVSISAFPVEDACESKGSMLRHMMMRLNPQTTHILFTDADIIVPDDMIEKVESFDGDYAVAERVDLTHEETQVLLNGSDPDTITMLVRKRVNPKKTGMGWFQFVKMDALKKIMAHLPWTHPGYDLFDWKVNEQLSQHFTPVVLKTDDPCLHLYHGDPGSTWQGTKKPL